MKPFAIDPADVQPLGIEDRLAVELDAIGDELERLGSELCADPAVAGVHLPRLQRIDEIVQINRAMSSVLRAADPLAAIDEITLADLRQRLSGGEEELAPGDDDAHGGVWDERYW